MTTIAGTIGVSGRRDGRAADASFYGLIAITMDSAGTFALVVDQFNKLIRRIDIPSYVVTTLAGQAWVTGQADGVGLAASFMGPYDIAMNAAGTFALIVRR